MKTAKRFTLCSLLVLMVVAVLAVVGSIRAAASQDYPTGVWLGRYFDSRWPDGEPALTRHDAFISFDWGTGSPDVAVPADNFSVRWTQTADFSAGSYRFWAVHDDGIKLWVDEQLLIEQWYDQPAYLEWTTIESVGGVSTTVYHKEPIVHVGEVTLTAGPHRVKVEYYEHGKNAVARVGWGAVEPAPSADSPASADGGDGCGVQHVVQAGEWLYKIARAYGVTVNGIMEANGLTSARLTPGQVLTIPTGTCPAPTGGAGEADSSLPAGCRAVHVVAPGDNLYRIALKYGVSFAALIQHNDITYPDYIIHVGQRLCIP